ncbi:NADPH-dependent glutamate synthase [Chlorobium sp. BLA1]|uniref:NADPH-dependent glutamate synthase n=1 Tax=Candidatus Chlorobium masyuteum TaxID=2716876 RepID=UPI00142084D0|nr:NADPH-dependent glutamate synthase [Candidatus Chlorobium masyuteum]NHQ59288.1 NADPH-dependent glutamate synthase [Candidatus Chlorobium masyuteum]
MDAQHITKKERMAIPRQEMPAQNPDVRNKNFMEVNLGYTAELAQEEALRCIQCKDAPCIKGCPVNIKIDQFIKLIAEGDFTGAARKIKEDNVLPAICGRVCPQEDQCEKECVVGRKNKPVAIGNLERFAADYERESGSVELPKVQPSTGKKVAVIGSGPAGLSCANDLIQLGHAVTVFEALHELGGVLMYGIPEFRLPKTIVQGELEGLKKLGVNFVTNTVAGRTVTIDELLKEEDFDAIFIGVGAGLPWFMGIPGENLLGVYSANEFLTRVNLMKSYQFPDNDTPVFNCKGKNVAVFGGGNTAMDAVRTAKRLGAEHAYIVYRRSEAEMPARKEEIHHAREEGIEFLLLMNPLEFIGNEAQWLTGAKCLKMELGEPDESGRRKPVPIKDSEFILPIDMAIISIGNGSNPLINQTTPDIAVSKRDTIVVDINTMATSKESVYAGGDIVTGGATVILAMGAGRTAAKAIHEKLTR